MTHAGCCVCLRPRAVQLAAEWLETNPAALSAIVSKALMAAKAADAAKKARELVRVLDCVK